MVIAQIIGHMNDPISAAKDFTAVPPEVLVRMVRTNSHTKTPKIQSSAQATGIPSTVEETKPLEWASLATEKMQVMTNVTAK